MTTAGGFWRPIFAASACLLAAAVATAQDAAPPEGVVQLPGFIEPVDVFSSSESAPPAGAPVRTLQPAAMQGSEYAEEGFEAPNEIPPTRWQPTPPVASEVVSTPWIAPYQTRGSLTVLPGSGDDVGITEANVSELIVFPQLRGLSLTPSFGTKWWDGPNATDVPGHLHTVALNVRWMAPLNEQWSYMLAVTPSMYSDFDNTGSDAFRFLGQAMVFYKPNPQFQWVFGAVYLDREDITALPAVGLTIVSPDESSRWEFIFPRPRYAKRIHQQGRNEDWLYLAGEFGGGSWAIDRANGRGDILTYSDLRLIVGYERKRPERFTTRFEAGWVFNREIEYRSNLGNFDPGSTALLRVAVDW